MFVYQLAWVVLIVVQRVDHDIRLAIKMIVNSKGLQFNELVEVIFSSNFLQNKELKKKKNTVQIFNIERKECDSITQINYNIQIYVIFIIIFY